MASIKCRYTKTVCLMFEYHGLEIGRTCWELDDWELDNVDKCPYFHTKEGKALCEHTDTISREFEKTVKNYDLSIENWKDEFSDECGYLTIGRLKIRVSDINYLEIDGRVLINKED